MSLLLSAQPIDLSREEQRLLQSHPLRCVTTATWPPFNVRIDGRLQGIGIDYWRTITERLGIEAPCRQVESWSAVLDAIRSGKADITIATQPTPERSKYAVFSKPYARYPYVIVTRNDIGFIHDLRLIKDRTIVAGKGFSVVSVLREHYPFVRLEETRTVREALERVKRGEAFAAIDALPVMAYLLNSGAFDSLKISGTLTENFTPNIMIHRRDKALVPLINRAIDSITPDERLAINAKWIHVRRPPMVPAYYIYSAAFAVGISLVGMYLLFVRAHRLKKEIGRKENDLKQLETLASIDSLTSIYNRYMLDTVLTHQIEIADRYRKMLSVIFFDIDRFKAINDRFGHSVGDEVLIRLAQLVSRSIRGSDIFGRWGGDEFMIILPESSLRQARRLARALDRLIREYDFDPVEEVSCSFGVVAYRFGDTVKSLLARADRELYAVKQQHHAKDESDVSLMR
jgi:polar amino acid transport system substrate-binding protein